jgi:hypothetical protein
MTGRSRSNGAVTDALNAYWREANHEWCTSHPVGKVIWEAHPEQGGDGRIRLPGADVFKAQQEETARRAQAMTDVLCRFEDITTDDFDRAIALAGRISAPLMVWECHQHGSFTDDRVLAMCVTTAWSSAEYPEQSLGRDLWRELFHATGYTVDGVPAERPAEPTRLYRGTTQEGRYGWAWTSDRAVAERFACGVIRGQTPGRVWTALVEPQRLLAFIHEAQRNESEYVVETDGLTITVAD